MNDEARWDRVELDRIMSTYRISEGVLFGRVVAGLRNSDVSAGSVVDRLRGVSVSAHEGEVGGCVDSGTTGSL